MGWELNSAFSKLHMYTFPVSHHSSPGNSYVHHAFDLRLLLPSEDMYMCISEEEDF